jgi:hypothetical protein
MNAEVQGTVSLYDINKHGLWTIRSTESNQIQWSWGEIACHLFGDGNPDYKISAMYVEFENTSGTPTTPSYTRDEGKEYYDTLYMSATKDFLRVPLLSSPAKGLASGYHGIAFNQLTFLAQTAGTQGVHGKTFSNGSNSKVYGLALVATPSWSDSTRDVVFARKYYATANQVAKQASSQIGVSWIEKFK